MPQGPLFDPQPDRPEVPQPSGRSPAFDEPLASLLRTALGMERQLANMLPELISETPDSMLRKELEQHLDQTHEHVQNVEEVFRAFGQEPRAAADPLLESLQAEHRASVEGTAGAPPMLTVVATAAAAEHVEIARYEVLRALAESCGNSRAVELLVRTLGQERQALKLVCESMHRLLARIPPLPGNQVLPAPF